jgi:hypothetical protein
MSILLALGGAAAAVASFVLLMSNVMGACNGPLCLLYTMAFVVLSVVGAFGLNNLVRKK